MHTDALAECTNMLVNDSMPDLLFLTAADILIINNHVIVQKCSSEGTNFYIVGSDQEVSRSYDRVSDLPKV
jgi:hypothetical protein